jgi:hypothetical protein
MAKRLDWREPRKELDGQTPEEWLAEVYADEPLNRVLAKRLSGLLDRPISKTMLDAKAMRMSLSKTDEARRKLNEVKAETLRVPLRPALIKFTDALRVEADPVAVTSDWHIPFYDERLVRRLMLICQHWKPPIKSLIVAGDFLDLEQMSRFVPARDAEREDADALLELDLRATEEMLAYLVEWFKRIDVFMGNHEERLYSRKLERQIGYERLSRLWMPQGIIPKKRIRFSHYRYCILNDEWRISHPDQHWKNLNRLAQELAAKYQSNYMLAHSHKMSVGYDISGRWLTVDLGAMVDPEVLAYHQRKDTTAWSWCPGFVIVSNGKPHSFNDKWTDWEHYRKALDIPIGW